VVAVEGHFRAFAIVKIFRRVVYGCPVMPAPKLAPLRFIPCGQVGRDFPGRGFRLHPDPYFSNGHPEAAACFIGTPAFRCRREREGLRKLAELLLEHTGGYNPMSTLNPLSDNFVPDAEGLGQAIVYQQNEGDHWTDSARDLVTGLIMYAAANGSPAEKI
jgi:hypothetical protein